MTQLIYLGVSLIRVFLNIMLIHIYAFPTLKCHFYIVSSVFLVIYTISIMSALKLRYTRSMLKVAGPYVWVNANRWIRNQMFYILIMIPLSNPLSETVHLMFSSPESSGSQV